jgi:effector-binding domain-containing protein
MVIGENAVGVGAWYTWDSKKMGKGKMTITESAENDSIRVMLVFEEKDTAYVSYRFEKVGDNETRVTQSMVLAAKGYVDKLKIAIGHAIMNGMFEKGLANVKDLAEKMPVEVETPGRVENIREEMSEETKYLSQIDTITPEMLPEHKKRVFSELAIIAGTQNLEQAGQAFAIYHVWDPEKNQVVVECAFPVNKEGKSDGRITYNVLSSENTIVAEYYGPEMSEKGHMAIMAYAEENKKKLGSPREIYMNDASQVDSMEVHTRIVYPVK